MKQLSFVLLLYILLGTTSSFAQKKAAAKGKLTWYTDLVQANELSKSTHKPIFGFFTGSDWCGWCRKLQNEVFEKTAFIKWAQQKVILLELDFPRQKQLPPELAQQNQSLQRAFQVGGFPTVWLFYMVKDDTANKYNITPLGSLGYPAGAELGKEEIKFIQTANDILAKTKT